MVLTAPTDIVFDGRGGVIFGENGIRRLPRIREQIGRRLPVVKDLARLNLIFQ